MHTVGTLVRTWRERALMTQDELAERAGLNVRTVRRLESGDGMRPYTSTLRLLAEALGLTADEQDQLRAAAGGHSDATAATTSRPATSTQPDVPQQLPATASSFTGRVPELARLDTLQDLSTVTVTVIDGMAGIGKTALAVHAAHRIAGHFPDGQLFLDLHGYSAGVAPVHPGFALDSLLRTVGIPGPRIPPDVDARAALWRSSLAGAKVLVVLDNAVDEAQVAPLLPGTPGCSVIVTSRRRLTGLDGAAAVSLDVLPLPDAVALLRSGIDAPQPGAREIDDTEAADVVELCGRLPLAVRIAAARLRAHPAWTAAHLIDRLRDHRRRLDELESGPRSVTAALDLSYDQLTTAEQRAYHRLGLHPGAEISAEAAAALLDTPIRETERHIEQLLAAHLIQEPAPARYRFHDLVRAHALSTAERAEPEAARRAARDRLLEHYRHATSAAMDLAYPYERDRRPISSPADTTVPALRDPGHALAWLDAELPNVLTLASYAAHHDRPEHVLHQSATLHRHLRGRGRYTDADALHTQAATLAHSIGDRPAEMRALSARGHIHRLQGRNDDAERLYTAALAAVADLGGQRVEPLVGLGHVHRLRGHHDRAADLLTEARRLARADDNLSGELDAVTALGWLRRQQGDHDRAVEEFTRARDLARETGNRSVELDALTGLGWLCHQRHQAEQAIRHFEAAAAISREIGNRHGELNAMTGLGNSLRRQGRPAEAIAVLSRCLTAGRQLDNRNLQFEALQGMGRAHLDAGHPTDARACHHEALALATQLNQPADQANAHDGIARTHHALGEHVEARRHWQRALAQLTELDIDHTEDGEVTTAALRSALRNSLHST